MSWVKIDDGFADHPKILAAGADGVCLWLCGLAYCNRQPKRDGFIPATKVPVLYPMKTVRQATDRLVAAGLWESVEGGFVVHDYHDFQPTAEKAASLSEKRAAAGRAGGRASGESRRTSAETDAKQFASHVASGGEANVEAKPNPVPVPGVSSIEETHPPAAVAASVCVGFDRFWGAYPLKRGKRDAEKIWKKIRPDDGLLAKMLDAIAWQSKQPRWGEEGGRFIPYPATWLNSGRWEDEPGKPKVASNAGSPPTKTGWLDRRKREEAEVEEERRRGGGVRPLGDLLSGLQRAPVKAAAGGAS